jgi:hypothetical protein
MFHPEFSELKTSGTLLAFTFLQIGPDSGHNYYLWQVVVSSAHPFFPAGPNPEAPARQTRAPLPSKPSCDFFRASHSPEASAFRNSGRRKPGREMVSVNFSLLLLCPPPLSSCLSTRWAAVKLTQLGRTFVILSDTRWAAI